MTIPPWFYSTITEFSKQLAHDAIDSNQVTSGSHTKSLESELATILNSSHCLYVNSGTSALAMSLIASGASPTSRILTSGVGWIATPQAIQVIGATPHILDVQEDLPIINLSDINDHYDYIIPVNYNGRQVDLSPISGLATSPCIIEDSCKSLFSSDYTGTKYSGLNGRFGCFSLGMISSLPGIYGGIIATDSDSDFDNLSTIKWHGVSYKDGNESYDFKSFNFKSSNVHAAIALGMLSSIEERFNKLRLIYSMYEEGLSGLENTRLLPIKVDRGELPLLIDLVSTNRQSHTLFLQSLGIPTCNYHKSLSSSPDVHVIGTTPNSEFFGSSVYHPPCGPDQDLSLIERAIQIIRTLG